MTKLPISAGILSYNSTEVLTNTLNSYKQNGLLDILEDVFIFFQKFSESDKQIAESFNLRYIPNPKNLGIGIGLLELAKNAKCENLLILEHDWELIEDTETTYNRLFEALSLISQGYKQVKFRHRYYPGNPLYSKNAYKGRELTHYDKVIDLVSPNLLSCIHWIDNPQDMFEQISKVGNYFTTTSRWSNFTNNPCLFNTNFYIEYSSQFIIAPDSPNPYNTPIGQITSEGEISHFWARQNYPVAHGEGLFMHNDFKKYNR